MPEKVALKEPRDFKLIGTPHRRLDTSGKVDGSAKFGIDSRPPGMKFAVVAASPTFGGKLDSLDEAKAKAVPGVTQVVRLGDAVAVVGRHTLGSQAGACGGQPAVGRGAERAAFHRRHRGAACLRIAKARRARPARRRCRRRHGTRRTQDGCGVRAALSCTRGHGADELHRAHHAGRLRHLGRHAGAGPHAGCRHEGHGPEARSRFCIHNHLLGGGFGRRLEFDGTVRAVQIAQQVEGPVQVLWTREEDIQHDMYRPYYYDRLSAGVDATGKALAWTHRIAGSSIVARYSPAWIKNGVDPDAVDGSANQPYGFSDIHVDWVALEPPGVPTAFWRGVGVTRGTFAVESFVDELAAHAKQDPLGLPRGPARQEPARQGRSAACRTTGRLGQAAAGAARLAALRFARASAATSRRLCR